MINYNVLDVLVQISQTHCEGAILYIKMKQKIYPLFSQWRITDQYFVICIYKVCTQNRIMGSSHKLFEIKLGILISRP